MQAMTKIDDAVKKADEIKRAWIGSVCGVQTKAMPDGSVFQFDDRGSWVCVEAPTKKK